MIGFLVITGSFYDVFSHGCDDSDDPDGADLDGDVVRRDIRVDGMEPGIELPSSEAEARADTKQGGQDGEDVNQITNPAKDPVAEDRIKAGLHRHPEVFSEGHQAQQESDQAVDDPPVDAFNF